MEPRAQARPTHSGARGKQARGERRRQSLIRAGTEILAEQGWRALTSRAVAERAGATPGLVYYHFGDQAALKRAIASAAVAEAFEPVLSVLAAHDSWESGVSAVAAASQVLDVSQTRVSAELFAASVHDEEVATVMREALAQARAQLAPWLRTAGNPEGLAILIVAMLDGLFLHRLIDPGLPVHEAALAVRVDLNGAGPAQREQELRNGPA